MDQCRSRSKGCSPPCLHGELDVHCESRTETDYVLLPASCRGSELADHDHLGSTCGSSSAVRKVTLRPRPIFTSDHGASVLMVSFAERERLKPDRFCRRGGSVHARPTWKRSSGASFYEATRRQGYDHLSDLSQLQSRLGRRPPAPGSVGTPPPSSSFRSTTAKAMPVAEAGVNAAKRVPAHALRHLLPERPRRQDAGPESGPMQTLPPRQPSVTFTVAQRAVDLLRLRRGRCWAASF